MSIKLALFFCPLGAAAVAIPLSTEIGEGLIFRSLGIHSLE